MKPLNILVSGQDDSLVVPIDIALAVLTKDDEQHLDALGWTYADFVRNRIPGIDAAAYVASWRAFYDSGLRGKKPSIDWSSVPKHQ